MKVYENGSYKLEDVNSKVHKTRVHGWRLKPYFLRFEIGANSSTNSNSGSTNKDGGVSIPSKKDWE